MFFIAVSLAVLFQKFTFVGSTVSAIIILLFFLAFSIILFNYFLKSAATFSFLSQLNNKRGRNQLSLKWHGEKKNRNKKRIERR